VFGCLMMCVLWKLCQMYVTQFFLNFIFSYEDFEDECMQDTELLVAGFPCIDVSRAGLRRGLEGQVCCSPT
jgi:site-specific DNA-cytosine methylase